VLVAVMVLGVGVMALTASSAMVTRMIGRGKVDTRAAQIATQQIEAQRLVAYSTTPHCTALTNAGAVTANHVTTSRTVEVTGTGRTVRVIFTYATPGGSRTDTLTTYIEC
jgi:Tfp pilus assembly protein PilV